MKNFIPYLAHTHSLTTPEEELESIDAHIETLEDYRLGLIKKDLVCVLRRFFAYNPHITAIRMGGDQPEDKADPFWMRAQRVDQFFYTPEFENNKNETQLQETSSKHYASLFDWEYGQKNTNQNFFLNTISLEKDKHFVGMLAFTVYAHKIKEFEEQILSPQQHLFFKELEERKIKLLQENIPTQTKNQKTQIKKI